MPRFTPLLSIAAALLLAGPVLAQSGGGVSGDDKTPDVVGGHSREAPEAGSDQAKPDDDQSAERQDEGNRQERREGDQERGDAAIGSREGAGTSNPNPSGLPLGGNARGTSKGDPSGSGQWPSQ